MKNMTFNFTAGMVLVVRVNEFIAGVLIGMILNVLDNNAYKFEESSFLGKACSWMFDHQLAVLVIACLIADVISVFILSAIF